MCALGAGSAPRAAAQPALPAPEPSEIEDDSEAQPIEFHGFVSQGFIKSTGNNYLADSKRGSFELNEVGFNFTKVLTDRLRVGLQLFSRDVGPIGNYTAHIDWFYLDYQLADWLGLRAGRTKLPFGLYNEVSDTDSARVPVLLPQSIYPLRNRDYLLAQTGLELYGFIHLGPVGGVEYRLYGGTIYLDLPGSSTGRFKVEDLAVPYLVGGRLLWETPLPGLRLGGSVQDLRLDYRFSGASLAGNPGAPGGVATAQIPALLWVGSFEYAGDEVLLAAEYSRWTVDVDSSVPDVVPSTSTVSERFYVMGAYRISNWLTPGAYYSALFPNQEIRKGRQAYQHDIALSLRFDVNTHWLFKLEGHYMRGTADLTPALNGGVALTALEKNWAVFLAKTTVHF